MSAIQAAVIFLTRPLIAQSTSNDSHSPSALLTLQLFLQNTLSSNPNPIQLLSFSPTSLPPLPIQLTCVTFRLKWTDWIQALGGSAFDLVIEPTSVYVVKKATGQIGVVWIGNSTNDFPPAFVRPSSSVGGVSTLSEESAIEADGEKDTGSNISRPSSRSSILSDSAFSSFSSRSSTSSNTSLSSFSHLEKPSKEPESSSPLPITPTQTLTPHANANAKATTTPTRYLYQGGVSTVLTGGVMLGTPSSPKSPPSSTPSSTPVSSFKIKTHIPTTTVGATKYTPPHTRQFGKSQYAGFNTPTHAGAISSWRRGACRSIKA